MNSVLLDFVWSGILIGESFTQFWYIIPATIVIEIFYAIVSSLFLWLFPFILSRIGLG